MDVVKKGTKFSILFGLLGQSLLTGLVAGYITYFGTDIVGVSALAMGNILLISRIFDGVTDLMMGAVIDKTKSKKGKARPWIFRAMIPFALFTILLFALPVNFGAGAKIVWIFVMYNLYAIAYTALGCAMNTLNIRLTRNEKEINSLSTFMMFGMILGNVVINASAVGILTALSGGSSNYTQSAFVIMAIILSVVSLLGSILTYVTTKEIPDEEKRVEQKESTLKSVSALLKNKYWMMQLLNTVCIYLGLNCRLAAMIYYGLYVLKNPGLIPVLVIADNVPSLIAMPFALGISNKIGKRKASLIGLCCTMIGFALMFLNIYNLPIFILGLVIKGICFAPVQGAGNAFVADSALYGEWKFGVKSEGMAYSAISFANKVSSGLSGVLVGWVLGLTGYVANAATQTPAATNGIIFLYIGVTFICTVVQIIIFVLYNLDGKMPEIRNALAVKNTEK
ncbi:Glucuronide carrier protein [[Ruminococcus] torques]|uniref:Glucuronide carrier protein n=1 Tax=[Ruminococcus] torques TaxID=33039 RepID=A0A564UA58_9FIRM|nr:glycoside-pentoside-hexuronide (GPH):cation symporter [[Ruminococcus] torques]VUX16347.1 Glucuronide carrier protein [[Ruminococcus] torques]